ncbi:MAG: nucleoside-diphosphate kinase [Dehalococcoidia bacterium]|nr:MAG: nucleoside-diphosphate kinase [Dehalococcoidia bacterium]
MEKSLVLIKPDAVERNLIGKIIGRIEDSGMKLLALRMLLMGRKLAEKHYAVHADKPFFKGLVSYITSGPIVACVFGGENAVEVIRGVMGATDPAKAAPGTIRKAFAENIERNSVHGSDAPETAKEEIALFFSDKEIFG